MQFMLTPFAQYTNGDQFSFLFFFLFVRFLNERIDINIDFSTDEDLSSFFDFILLYIRSWKPLKMLHVFSLRFYLLIWKKIVKRRSFIHFQQRPFTMNWLPQSCLPEILQIRFSIYKLFPTFITWSLSIDNEQSEQIYMWINKRF